MKRFEDFYGCVVQGLMAYTPQAPKLGGGGRAAMEPARQPIESAKAGEGPYASHAPIAVGPAPGSVDDDDEGPAPSAIATGSEQKSG